MVDKCFPLHWSFTLLPFMLRFCATFMHRVKANFLLFSGVEVVVSGILFQNLLISLAGELLQCLRSETCYAIHIFLFVTVHFNSNPLFDCKRNTYVYIVILCLIAKETYTFTYKLDHIQLRSKVTILTKF